MATRAVVWDSGMELRRLAFWRFVLVSLALIGCMAISHAARAELPTQIDRDAFLRAIAEVETGGNPRAVGRHGERGLYQFRRTTWRQHTTRSFLDAHNPGVAHDVASRHFDWIAKELTRRGRQPTPYLIAVAWNGGISRAVTGRAAASTRDYARRVTNLTALFQPRKPAAPVAAVSRESTGLAESPSLPAVPVFFVSSAEEPRDEAPLISWVEPVQPVKPAAEANSVPRFFIGAIID